MAVTVVIDFKDGSQQIVEKNNEGQARVFARVTIKDGYECANEDCFYPASLLRKVRIEI